MRNFNNAAMELFGEKLVEEIESTTDYKVNIHKVNKVNLGTLHGLTLKDQKTKSGKTDISPTFYLEDIVESFFFREKSIKQIAREIVNLHIQHKPKNIEDVSWVLDFEAVKNAITYRIVNPERNAELLKKVPYKRFLDLAVVYYIDCGDLLGDVMDEKDFVGSFICIHNDILKSWGIDLQELDALAEENTRRLNPVRLDNLFEKVFRMIHGIPDDMNIEDLIADVKGRASNDDPIVDYLILSNRDMINGASCLLYKGLLEDLWKRLQSNFFILPSSVHEVLIVPQGPKVKREVLKNMVLEVNDTVLKEEDFLSDSIYYYDGKLSFY